MQSLLDQALVLDGGFRPPCSYPVPAKENVASVSPEERRRLRRMISNRESARRSRERKQRHLEELRVQAGHLRSENSDLAGRLGRLSHRCLLLRRDNDRLLAEASALRRRLAELRRAAALRQLHPPPLASQFELAWAASLMA